MQYNSAKRPGEQSKKEIQEVLNLPDNLGGKKKGESSGNGTNLNDDLLNDFMKRKNLLNRINTKFSPAAAGEMANKPATELHD